jgi:hypothetical protein
MAIAISLAALAVSLSAFLHGRWRDRRDLSSGSMIILLTLTNNAADVCCTR